MAKQSVLGSPQYTGSTGHRTGFPMSQDYTFTAGLGMLLPAYKQFLNLGEHVNGIPRLFVRTEPFLAPAMADIDVYCDVFFVPMRHLISMFDDWYTQVDDAPSSLWNTTQWKEHLPVLSGLDAVGNANPFGWVDQVTFNGYQHGNRTTGQLVNFGFGAHRLTQMLGYNAQSLFSSANGLDFSDDYSNVLPEFVHFATNLDENPFTPYYHMAYQKIYYDYYRDSNFEPNFVKAYNLDAAMNAGLASFNPKANPTVCDQRMFALRYRQRSKDYFQAVHPSPLFNGMGMLPHAKENLMRVKNWLTDQSPVFLDSDNSIDLSSFSYPPDVSLVGTNPFETDNNNSYEGYVNGYPVGFINASPLGSLRSLNGSSAVGNPIVHTHNFDVEKLVEDQALTVEAQGGASDSGIALAQIRAAFAMDKLLRVTNRAGKHVDDQMLAQFGVKIPQGVSGEVYKIKSYHSMIHIGEVIQSATTVDSSGNDVPLGELAGRGVAELNTRNDKDKFDFTAPCHGILMCIVSFSPRYKYIFTREKDGYKVYLEDFFRPAYDNLGMQPTEFFEYGHKPTDPSVTITPVWQYRYMEDKLKHDRTSYVFATVSKNPWSFTHAVEIPTINYTAGLIYGFTWQKVMPYDSNNLFVVQYNGNPHFPQNVDSNPFKNPSQFLSAYLTDPFTVDFSMQCSKVSQMSTYGEPSLGGL